MTLKERRDQWEADLEPLFQVPDGKKALSVVLTGEDGGYHVHFYMHVGMEEDDDRWDVSADVQNGSHEDVVNTLVMRHGFHVGMEEDDDHWDVSADVQNGSHEDVVNTLVMRHDMHVGMEEDDDHWDVSADVQNGSHEDVVNTLVMRHGFQ